MPEIPYDEETSRDWDWFAVDSNGEVGHLTTAGFRLLPASVKADWELAEELISFFESLPNIGEYQVRSEFWASRKQDPSLASWRKAMPPGSRTYDLSWGWLAEVSTRTTQNSKLKATIL